MSLLAQPRVLWRLLRGLPRTGSIAERLAAFYAPQADHYDSTRDGLLHGRPLLVELLDLAPVPRSTCSGRAFANSGT